MIPAEFRDVPVSRLVQPAGQVAQPVAPQQKTINTRVLRSPERFEWVPVLCNTNSNHSSISRVQTALTASGHYNGQIDGVAGPQTHSALRDFQSENGLVGHGNVTAETAQALGVGDVVSGTAQPAAAPGSPWNQRVDRRIPDRWSPPVQQGSQIIEDTVQAAPAPIAPPADVADAPAYTRAAPAPVATAPVLRERKRRLTWAGKTEQ